MRYTGLDTGRKIFFGSYYGVVSITGVPGKDTAGLSSAEIRKRSGLKVVTVFKEALYLPDRNPLEVTNCPMFRVLLFSGTIHTTYTCLGGVNLSGGARWLTCT